MLALRPLPPPLLPDHPCRLADFSLLLLRPIPLPHLLRLLLLLLLLQGLHPAAGLSSDATLPLPQRWSVRFHNPASPQHGGFVSACISFIETSFRSSRFISAPPMDAWCFSWKRAGSVKGWSKELLGGRGCADRSSATGRPLIFSYSRSSSFPPSPTSGPVNGTDSRHGWYPRGELSIKRAERCLTVWLNTGTSLHRRSRQAEYTLSLHFCVFVHQPMGVLECVAVGLGRNHWPGWRSGVSFRRCLLFGGGDVVRCRTMKGMATCLPLIR